MYRLGTGNRDERDISEMVELIFYLIKQNRLYPAIACLRLAVFYHPDIYQLWMILGEVYDLQGDRENAVIAYQESLVIINNNRDESLQPVNLNQIDEERIFSEYVN